MTRPTANTSWPRFAAASVPGLLVAMLSLAQPAAATAVAGHGGTAEQGRRVVVAMPAPAAVAGSLDLVGTRIDAVDQAAGTITVRGQVVPLHAQQLRVLGQGGQVLSQRSLRAGQLVRLALEPLQPAAAVAAASAVAASPAVPRRIVLIYIDG